MGTFLGFTSDRKFDSIVDVLAHYISRLALVGFIEIFSFFLRLYRSTLEEIRIYQEKLNSAANQKVAIELVWALNEPAARAAFATTLLTAKSHADAKTPSSDDVEAHALAKVVGQLVKLVPSSGVGKQS